MDAQLLEDRLAAVIAPRRRVLTAFSGGVDSTLVAAMARKVLGRDAAPVGVGDSASLARHELDEARQLARQLDLAVIEVAPHEEDDTGYRANAGDRCYYCKTHLYAALRPVAEARGIEWIANGTNVDDLGDHRPGLTAADEAQVISPLVEAQLGKAEVRQLARHLGLPNWDKPAAACLASRIPYHTAVTVERLGQVERAEKVLREQGLTGFRVRHHEQVARIELPWEQVHRLMADPTRDAVIAGLKNAGYHFVTLDLEGFRSGSGNVVLGGEGVRKARRHEGTEARSERKGSGVGGQGSGVRGG